MNEKVIKHNATGEALYVEIIDERDDGMHYKAIVKNEKFGNKSLVEKHRMVLDVLKEDFKSGKLHSLSIEIKE